MQNPWPHRLAILVTALALLLLVGGALLTDYRQLVAPPAMIEQSHTALGIVAAVFTLALAIWLTSGGERWAARMAWVALALMVGDGIVGQGSMLAAFPKAAGVWHAILAQLGFAAIAILVPATSKQWKTAEQVHDQGWPSLRFLGNTMFLLVLLQVSLGAAFRHKASGLMPHLVGAMVVALWILIVCMFVMQQFPEHRALRPAANFLLAVTLTQVFLGIGALTMRMLSEGNTTGLLASTAGHVATGALTLATATVLTLQIRRNVLPKVAVEESDEEAEQAG